MLDAGVGGTYPDPVEHCELCRWQKVCDARREADDHLSLVANMRRAQTLRLNEAGIATVAQLAGAASAQRPMRIGAHTFEALRDQARLQVEQRTAGQARYELLAPEDDRGFARLPPPSEGDVFFDMEGDPFFEDGLEYLFGVTWIEADEPRFRPFWATSRTEEKRAFEEFVDFIIERLERFPDMHVYHYAAYEPTALKRLMGLHATREEEIDHLLRNDVLVDLYAVVRQALRISQPSYSIKRSSPSTWRSARRTWQRPVTRSSPLSSSSRAATVRCSRRSSATTRTTAAPPGCFAKGPGGRSRQRCAFSDELVRKAAADQGLRAGRAMRCVPGLPGAPRGLYRVRARGPHGVQGARARG